MKLSNALAMLTAIATNVATSKARVTASRGKERNLNLNSENEATDNEGGPPKFIEGEIIIKFKNDVNDTDKENVKKGIGVTKSKKLSKKSSSAELINVNENANIQALINQLKAKDEIDYAEPNYIVEALETLSVPNDPDFSQLWGMKSTTNAEGGCNAEGAWATGYTGSSDVIVGVIDTGIDYNHQDLAANMWVNPVENADDVHGYDFVYGDSDPFDGHGHGTHCAGTIGAVGNNDIGVVGVNWDVRIIAAKFLDDYGSGSTSNAVEAVEYLTDLKVNHDQNVVVSSNSWGGGGNSQALKDAISAGCNAGILFVAAAGNSDRDIDSSSFYPASYDNPCVISVASLKQSGDYSGFSNWGEESVDLAAPGSGIYSTLPNNSYASWSGTSMAAPHVSGAIALCKAVAPVELTALEIKDKLFSSVRPNADPSKPTFTNGQLDVEAFINECAGSDETVDPIRLSDNFDDLAIKDIVLGSWWIIDKPTVDRDVIIKGGNSNRFVRIKRDASITANVDTTGFSTVTLEYRRRTKIDDPGQEFFYVEWSNDYGANWIEIEILDNTVSSWTTTKIIITDIDSGAGNNTNCQLRFRIDGSNYLDHGDVDDVVVTGSN